MMNEKVRNYNLKESLYTQQRLTKNKDQKIVNKELKRSPVNSSEMSNLRAKSTNHNRKKQSIIQINQATIDDNKILGYISDLKNLSRQNECLLKQKIEIENKIQQRLRKNYSLEELKSNMESSSNLIYQFISAITKKNSKIPLDQITVDHFNLNKVKSIPYHQIERNTKIKKFPNKVKSKNYLKTPLVPKDKSIYSNKELYSQEKNENSEKRENYKHLFGINSSDYNKSMKRIESLPIINIYLNQSALLMKESYHINCFSKQQKKKVKLIVPEEEDVSDELKISSLAKAIVNPINHNATNNCLSFKNSYTSLYIKN